MGRYGQAILTIAGTIIGAYFNAPQLGALIGSLAGALLFPTQLPTQQGPRLADLTSTNSTVGAPIQEGWGVFTVAGTIIHQTDIREVIETEEVGGGSGGPSQKTETPTYYSDWALALVDCPDGPITGVRIIWANGKPIYDRRPQAAGESDILFSARMAANSQLDEQMVIYTGTDEQEPDPTLEAFYGVGQVSAHKQLAYIMFNNWLHKPEDGNRIPLNLKVEVIAAGEFQEASGTQYAQEVIFPWLDGGHPENPRNNHTYRLDCLGIGGPNDIQNTPIFSVSQGVLLAEQFRGKAMPYYNGTAATEAVLGGLDIAFLDQMGGDHAVTSDRARILVHYNSQISTNYYSSNHPDRSPVVPPPGTGYNSCFSAFPANAVITTDDGFTAIGIFTDTGNKQYKVVASTAGETGWDFANTGACPGFYTLESVGCAVGITRVPRAPDDPADPQGLTPYPRLPGTDDWYVQDGRIVHAGPWSQISGTFRVLQTYSAGSQAIRYPLGPAVPFGDPNYDNEEFWRAAYAQGRTTGKIPAGLQYGVHYPVGQGFAYTKTVNLDTIVAGRIPVAVAVEAICRRAGYLAEQINTDGLDGLDMIGYVRTRQMTARAAIDPLRQAKFFDGHESAREIKFVKRGGPIVRTFTLDELGVFPVGGDAPSKITTRKLQDTDLPKQVRVHYLSQSRDYELGEQDSPNRVDTKAVNVVDLEIPMVMEDSEAMQAAQGLWADAWAGRFLHEIQVSFARQELEPTDCVAVPVDGQTRRCRIMDVTDALPSHRKMTLVRDDAASYESFAVAETPPIIPPPLTILSPANVDLLDIPMIVDSHNDSGFYAAFRPLVAGAFKGAALYRSTDGGGNWVRVATSTNAAITGALIQPLGAGGYWAIDGANEVLVQLDGEDELSSITRAALLNGSAGSNAAAIGRDGRWEIVQFQTVEALGNRMFRLTVLLRGRRGTEHAIGSSEQGDRFVLLTGPGIIRVPLQLSEVGREYLYRAVGTGLTVDSADTIAFTGLGVALKPFSPVYIRGERDAVTGDWSIDFIRRGRIGQTMRSGVEIALSEDQEDYEVVIRDLNGAELRVLSVSEPHAVYLGSTQLTDFGIYPNPLTVEVYQISAQVGRGYMGTAVLSTLLPVLGDTETATFVAGSPDEPLTVGGG